MKYWHEEYQKKVLVPEQLPQAMPQIRFGGKTIVTLNGSFDLLHAGHLQMLYEAKMQGDVLIVALNTDASIQKNKGPERPILPLEERIQLIAALKWVDYVTYFAEEDPREILQKIRPDVHVNGAEYGENCIEAEVLKEMGSRLHLVERLPGLSTTNILEKLQKLCV